MNKKLQVIHASDTWLHDFSLDSTKTLGKRINDLVAEVPMGLRSFFNDCFSAQTTGSSLKRYLDENEEDCWFQWISKPWLDQKETHIGYIVQHEKASDHVENELRTKRAEALLQQGFELTQTGHWEYHAISDITTWDPIARSIYALDSDVELSFDNSIEFYTNGHSKNTLSMAIFEAIEKHKPWNERLELITSEGRKWVISSGKPIVIENEFIGLVGTLQDVTQYVTALQTSQEYQELLKTLIDNLPVCIYVKDLDSKKIIVNKAELQHSGYDNADALLGKSVFDLYPRKKALQQRKEDLMVINTLKPILQKETILKNGKGHNTIMLTSKIPLLDKQGEASGIIGIRFDISDLKKKENELRKLINITSGQNKQLVNFAHIVSHNLRSRTSNFAMLLDFLNDEKDRDQFDHILQMLIKESDILLETLDHLNEVVAINTKVSLDKKEVSLKDKVIEALNELAPYLESNHAEVINKIPEHTTITTVVPYLQNILSTFISNAVKFKDPNKQPILKISTQFTKENLILVFKDNGLGIDLKKYGDKLFGMYKTFHENNDARGIGLYLAKNQVEAMNGKITVASTVGKGTTFKIYFDNEV